MDRRILASAAACGFLAVAAGAFGSHLLKERLPADLLEVYQTGVLYHLVHAVALAVVAALAGMTHSTEAHGPCRLAGLAFLVGIVIFSGSLYALALTGVRGLGAVTPIGGLSFLAGWVLLAVAAVRAPVRSK